MSGLQLSSIGGVVGSRWYGPCLSYSVLFLLIQSYKDWLQRRLWRFVYILMGTLRQDLPSSTLSKKHSTLSDIRCCGVRILWVVLANALCSYTGVSSYCKTLQVLLLFYMYFVASLRNHFLLTGRCLSIAAAARARIVYFLPPDCAHCCRTS